MMLMSGSVYISIYILTLLESSVVKAATLSNVLTVCCYFCNFYDFFDVFRWIIFAGRGIILSAGDVMKK